MHRNIYLTLIFVLICLMGCGPQISVVKEKEYVPFSIPTTLKKDCDVTPPYPYQAYAQSTQDQKEQSSTDLINSLYKDLAKCNKDKHDIRDYETQMNKQIEEKNNAAKTH